MANLDENPDKLATKTFVITLFSAIVYFGAVAIFVLNGRPDSSEDTAHNDAEYPLEVPRVDQ